MARKRPRRRRGQAPRREPWPAVVAAVVAVVSLGLNGYQFLDNRALSHRIDEATADKLEREVAVELEVRYLVIPGLTVGSWPAGLVSDRKDPRVMENEVLASLQEFQNRAEAGGPVLEEFDRGQVVKAHAGVVLRIRNEGAVTARSLELRARRKDFPASGKTDAQVWSIDTTGWAETTRRLADLAPGGEVYFPLIHLVGSNRYLGAAYLPTRLTWQNVATHETEAIEVQQMAPEDQWLAEGLDVKVAQ